MITWKETIWILLGITIANFVANPFSKATAIGVMLIGLVVWLKDMYDIWKGRKHGRKQN